MSTEVIMAAVILIVLGVVLVFGLIWALCRISGLSDEWEDRK